MIPDGLPEPPELMAAAKAAAAAVEAWLGRIAPQREPTLERQAASNMAVASLQASRSVQRFVTDQARDGYTVIGVVLAGEPVVVAVIPGTHVVEGGEPAAFPEGIWAAHTASRGPGDIPAVEEEARRRYLVMRQGGQHVGHIRDQR